MESTLLAIKDVITHNTAQIRLYEGDIYEYLSEVNKYLLEQNLDVDTVNDIFLYAWRHSEDEINIIRDLKERYGIVLEVQGHGGSQIHPRVLLEKYFEFSR